MINIRLWQAVDRCERCMSSVTAEPQSAWCAQCRNEVWTYNDCYLECCRRNTQCDDNAPTESKNVCARNTKQGPAYWRLQANVKVLTWTTLLWQKLEVRANKCDLCSVSVFTPARMSAYKGSSESVKLCDKKPSWGLHSVRCHNLSHRQLVQWPSHWDEDKEDPAWCWPLFLLTLPDYIYWQMILGVLLHLWASGIP